MSEDKKPVEGAEQMKKSAEAISKFVNGVAENSKKVFLCFNCEHKAVCRKMDDPEEGCEDFMDATTYKQYASIYHFFQPIFDWIKFHYPAGEVKFLVDHNSARMLIEHGPFVASKELKEFPSLSTGKGEEER